MSAYLFAHFTSDSKGDKESIWFALSRDGLNWTDIGTEEPVITTDSGTGGIRDPFILYDEREGRYIIIGTDLNTRNGGSWDDFSSRGSRSIFVWESKDLISWSEPCLVEVGIEKAGCVWAPEAVYCKEKESWFVFFASNVKEEGEDHAKQRIYGTFTKDFRSFTPTFKYIDGETALIDTDIIRDGDWYYRFSKDETNKVIILERSRELVGENSAYERVCSELLDGFYGLEGPEAFYLSEQKKWCLIVDRYHGNKGYLPLICEDLSKGIFTVLQDGEYSMGKRKKRHGSVIEITDEEADRLTEHFGISEA